MKKSRHSEEQIIGVLKPMEAGRKVANLPGLRFHDLRHTVITELAEMGVPDHVMGSISGHLSRRMLEHYSHVRLDAKRNALEALDAWRQKAAADELAKVAVQ